MNPQKIAMISGARLAFAQGGPGGFKLVHLTPPVKTILHNDFAEVKWSPANMPLKYTQAPLLIENTGKSDFPKLQEFIKHANLPTWERKFASKFRSCRTSLGIGMAKEIVRIFYQRAISNRKNLFASTYVEAMPYPPPRIDDDRQRTYLECLN